MWLHFRIELSAFLGKIQNFGYLEVAWVDGLRLAFSEGGTFTTIWMPINGFCRRSVGSCGRCIEIMGVPYHVLSCWVEGCKASMRVVSQKLSSRVFSNFEP